MIVLNRFGAAKSKQIQNQPPFASRPNGKNGLKVPAERLGQSLYSGAVPLSKAVNLDGTGKLRKIGGWGIVVLHGRAAKKLLPGEIQPTDSKQSIFATQPIRT